jgi:hypothetical protein
MTEPVLAGRTIRRIAAPDTITDVRAQLDQFWEDAPFVSEVDRLTFATAVIESAGNVVQHSVPESKNPVELGVDIYPRQSSLEAAPAPMVQPAPALSPAIKPCRTTGRNPAAGSPLSAPSSPRPPSAARMELTPGPF